MSPVLLTIITVIAIILLMAVQAVLSKLEKSFWGVIIPLAVVVSAVYAHFIVKVELTWASVIIFVVPFVWSLEEWYRGRKKRIAEAEKEISKMKAKDI